MSVTQPDVASFYIKPRDDATKDFIMQQTVWATAALGERTRTFAARALSHPPDPYFADVLPLPRRAFTPTRSLYFA